MLGCELVALKIRSLGSPRHFGHCATRYGDGSSSPMIRKKKPRRDSGTRSKVSRRYSPRSASLAERIAFHSIPEPNSGCLLWTGPLDSEGRPKIGISGKTRRVSRVVYELYRGPIPEGLFVCHKCDIRLCVNPDHLWTGTHLDNMRDRNQKKRHQHGERHTSAKLTREIVSNLRDGALTIRQVTALSGVTRQTAAKAKRGFTWKLL